MFTYLAPFLLSDPRLGSVLSFRAETMPILPEADGNIRSAYARRSTHGSLVKLYEYDWQGGRSNIVMSGGGLLRENLRYRASRGRPPRSGVRV